MERLFGDYLIKCQINEKPEESAPTEEKKDEQVNPDLEATLVEGDADIIPFYPYEKVSIDDAMVRT
mgnify:CR=1 FL=1